MIEVSIMGLLMKAKRVLGLVGQELSCLNSWLGSFLLVFERVNSVGPQAEMDICHMLS